MSNGEDPKGLDPKFGASPLIKKKKRGRLPLISGNPKPFKKPKADIPECFKGFKKPMETEKYFFMALNYISWNVRGLEASDRKYVVKRLLNSHRELDFMLLQEVKAIRFDLDIALRCIQRDPTIISTKHRKGKGGSSILISLNWKDKMIG